MILVTGGAGYVGAHANKALSLKGYDSVVYDNLVYGHRDFVKWGEFVHGDLADRDCLRACFKQFGIKAVMHFAAYTYVGESVEEPLKYYRNNVANTLNLIEVMREFGVNKIIFSSTCAVYGVPNSVPISEDHPRNPLSPYGRSKVMVEDILRDSDVAYGIKSVALRYFNAAGADPDSEIGELHDPETHLIPLVLDVAAGQSESVKVFGSDYETPDGTCVRDYIHVADLAEAHVLALEYLLTEGRSEVFNLGNGNGYSVKEVIETAVRVTGRDIRYEEAGRRAGHPPALVGSSGKARDMLNWRQRYNDLSVIIETAWRWHTKRR